MRRIARPNRRRAVARSMTMLAAVALALTACGGDWSDPGHHDPDDSAEEETSHQGWTHDADWADPGDHGASSPELESGAGTADATSTAPLAEGEALSEEVPTTAPGTEAIDTNLSAGSVDDNEKWEEYLLYRQAFLASGVAVEDVDVSGRQVLTVTTSGGASVLDATVQITDSAGASVATLRTFADGRAMFFGSTEVDPNSQERLTYTAKVSKGDESVTQELDPEASSHSVVLDADPHGEAVQLDVLFLIDVSGSMGDEIEQLKANMISVAKQIDELPGEPDARFAMTVYRDRDDSFQTNTFDFTDDIDFFISEGLQKLQANGGGDYPEMLSEAFNEAITVPAWRADNTVKLVFLVADAPPHLDYGGPSYADDALSAAAAGIKVLPIASSGLDAQGEYVYRQLAQLTMGRFVFLTYGADGVGPGEDTTMNVDDYSVLSLDELVVQLVTEELAHLNA